MFAIGAEVGAGGEGFAVGGVHGGLEVVEVDGGEGLGDVELAGFAVEAVAVPIEDAVGGVRVLLDFVDEEAGTDGVEAAGGDEDGVAGDGEKGVDVIGDGAVGDGVFEVGTGGAVFEADVEACAGIAIGDVPHFGFGLAVEGRGEVGGWVDLDGEVVAGVEDFDEDGKAGVLAVAIAEEFRAVVEPEVVEGFSGEGAVVDDGVFVGAVDDFPGFAVGEVRGGEGAVIDAFEFASAPDAVHVDRVEGDGKHGGVDAEILKS